MRTRFLVLLATGVVAGLATAPGAGATASSNAGCWAEAISSQAAAFGSGWGGFVSSTAIAAGGVGQIAAPEASTKICFA